MFWIQGPWHELEVDVASAKVLAYVCGGRPKRRISLQDSLAELVAFVGAGYVRCLHEPFTPPPDTLGDHLIYSSCRLDHVGEDKDVKEPEPAGNDLAFSESVLRSIFALLCDILDTGVGTIMVVIQLMQGSEISSEAQCKQLGVLDEVVVRCRLYNTITRRLSDANYIIGLVINIPSWRKRYSLSGGIMA
ncbi:MAG: hypothetical protein VX902_07255, partial [Planctomycetota bacterium]|nr:hypothetical protein [Planctomycetota bacterium]